MRINPTNITSYGISPYSGGSNNQPRSFVSFTASKEKETQAKVRGIRDSLIEQYLKKIDEYDNALPLGKFQGVYEFKPYMVKSPGGDKYAVPIKEYYILDIINNAPEDIKTDIAPKPIRFIDDTKRCYLFEEYIEGMHANNDRPVKMSDIRTFLDKLTLLDKNGIVNRDIQPSNIITDSKGNYARLVDFDTYTFLDEAGRISHSEYKPYTFYMKEMRKNGLEAIPHIQQNLSPKEKFALSFTHERKKPCGLFDLVYIQNMPDNPYISAPSNLPNFESKTLYRKIMDHDMREDGVISLIKEYRKYKGEVYHPSMKEFLKSLSGILDNTEGTLNIKDAKAASKRLKDAVEYEEFLSKLMASSKAEDYFAKLDAVKMQLNAMTYAFSSGECTRDNLHSAYTDLIRVISEGVETYDDKDIQRYLKDQLKMYVDAFSNTDFALTYTIDRVPHNFNILSVFFHDDAKDTRSFPYVFDKAKISARSAVSALRQNPDISEEELIKRARKIATDELEVAGAKVTKAHYDSAVQEVIDYALDKVKKGESFIEKIEQTANDAYEQSIRSLRPPVKRKLSDFDGYTSDLDRALILNKIGGRNFAIIGTLIALGAYGVYRAVKFQNEKKEKTKLALLTSNQDVLNNIKNDSKLDMFKQFIKK